MISEKDKIEQFKRELRSYDFYLKSIIICNQKLEEIGVKLEGVSSPRFKDVIYENARDPYKNNKSELMYQEEEVIKQRNHYLRQVEVMDKKLNTLMTSERELLISLYIRRKTYEKMADLEYISVRNLKYKVNAIIKTII